MSLFRFLMRCVLPVALVFLVTAQAAKAQVDEAIGIALYSPFPWAEIRPLFFTKSVFLSAATVVLTDEKGRETRMPSAGINTLIYFNERRLDAIRGAYSNQILGPFHIELINVPTVNMMDDIDLAKAKDSHARLQRFGKNYPKTEEAFKRCLVPLAFDQQMYAKGLRKYDGTWMPREAAEKKVKEHRD